MTQPQAVVYFAGPGVFRPHAKLLGETLKTLAAAEGIAGLWPCDNEIDANDPTTPHRQLYNANLAMIRRADAIVADISPFRGPHMDPGTAFEIGVAAMMRKPVFAYTESLLEDKRPRSLLDRVWRMMQSIPQPLRLTCRHLTTFADSNGDLIEDFGLVENLMVACAIEPDVANFADIAIKRAARHLRYIRARNAETRTRAAS